MKDINNHASEVEYVSLYLDIHLYLFNTYRFCNKL